MTVLIPLADGVEEIEAVTLIDVLRRAGLTVAVRAIGQSLTIQGSHTIKLLADRAWADKDALDCDALILPGGGPGTEALRQDARVLDVVRKRVAGERWVGAICAAPQVLQDAGVLAGRRVTCYPACRDGVSDAHWVDAPVVKDGMIVTSQGPGTAMAFALTFVGLLCGDDKRRAIADDLLSAD